MSEKFNDKDKEDLIKRGFNENDISYLESFDIEKKFLYNKICDKLTNSKLTADKLIMELKNAVQIELDKNKNQSVSSEEVTETATPEPAQEPSQEVLETATPEPAPEPASEPAQEPAQEPSQEVLETATPAQEVLENQSAGSKSQKNKNKNNNKKTRKSKQHKKGRKSIKRKKGKKRKKTKHQK